LVTILKSIFMFSKSKILTKTFQNIKHFLKWL
jgi:hypothetical protein